MNHIKIETTRRSYRIVGVFCDFDESGIEGMFFDFYTRYQLPKEFLVNDAVFKASVNPVETDDGEIFKFNVVERIK